MEIFQQLTVCIQALKIIAWLRSYVPPMKTAGHELFLTSNEHARVNTVNDPITSTAVVPGTRRDIR
jgi:hypothetical protein